MSYETEHLSFPEDLGEQAVLFEAKDFVASHSKRGIVTDKESKTTKRPLGSVSLYITPVAEAHSSTWDGSKTITAELASHMKSKIPFSSKGSMVLAQETGKAISNDTLATFQDISNRVFNFSYTLIPQSEKESTEIRKIIDFFRYHSLPGYDTRYKKTTIKIPSVFFIRLIGLGETWKNTIGIKPCVLRDFSVNYGEGDYMQLMEDNTPSKITLSLTFTEIYKPYKEDFEYGLKGL